MFTELSLFTSRNGKRRSSPLGSTAVVCQVQELEPRLTCSATPVAAQFNPKNNYGVTKIEVDGQNLLVGNGFQIIGSKTGNDTPDNVTSESPYNSNGIMRPGNNSTAGGSLPYSLTFSKNSNDRSKLNFSVSVGPSSDTFNALSIPLECKASYFTFWRSSASSAVKRYDQNPYAYTPPGGGPIYISHVPGSPHWGEIIGPKYTIRVTITSSSRPMGLYFVNAPFLAGGDRDVEFSFGTLRAGTKATVSGTIQVFRTDPHLLPAPPAAPALVFQSESPQYHQVGRRDGDGWSVNVKDKPKQYLQYGPYVSVGPSGVSPGKHTATFRILLDNVKADDKTILTIDVYDSVSHRKLAKMDITRKMFDTAFKYKEFTLKFDASAGQRLEFRTYWWGSSYAKQDSVTVR